MEVEEHKSIAQNISQKINNFLKDIWPIVYKNLNDGLDGLIRFIKDTISSVWRRY